MITSGDKAMKYLSKEELILFFKTVDKAKHPQHRLAFRLIVHFGLRVQEAVNIKLEDIELNESIGIQGIKKGRQRIYTGKEVPGKIWRCYKAWIKERGKSKNPYLFPSRFHAEKSLTAEALKMAFRSYVESSEIDSHYSIHALRHSCAIMMVKAKEQPVTIMNWLRHRSIASTQVYIESFIDYEAGVRQARRSESYL